MGLLIEYLERDADEYWIGETEWTISGQHTGRADIPLTARGERQVRSTGSLLVGHCKYLDPAQVQKVFVSPRQRATRTFQLLFAGETKTVTHADTKLVAAVDERIFGGGEGSIEVTEQVAEWDYGEYDGMLAVDVRRIRHEQGTDAAGFDWNVWRDGCVGGE